MVADHSHHYIQGIRSAASISVHPLHLLVDLPVTTIRWINETFATRSRLKEDNQLLRQQNLLLQVRQQKMEALKSENMRLRDLLGSAFKVDDRVLIAELIAVHLDPYAQQILIHKGNDYGVFIGQPVIDANGVIGQVTRVNPFTANVLMITDLNHSTPVQVNRNGLRAIATGTGKIKQLRIPNLPNNADIRVGDLLVTSGLGGHFPAGYPVATITAITHDPGQPFTTAEATPTAKLGQIREVLLVWGKTTGNTDMEQQP
jgi:rod shape-determining protein MreC